jgi:hypothetical protein
VQCSGSSARVLRERALDGDCSQLSRCTHTAYASEAATLAVELAAGTLAADMCRRSSDQLTMATASGEHAPHMHGKRVLNPYVSHVQTRVLP